MKIVLFGASGFVGSALLKEALDRNHRVTAIVREPGKISVQHPHLTIIKGNVLSDDNISEYLSGHDIIINAFNAGWDNPDIYDDYLKGARNIEKATKIAGIPRLLVMGGAGSLFKEGSQIVDQPTFPAEIKPGAVAGRDYLNELRNKDFNWTYLSPALDMHRGTSGVRKGHYRLGLEEPVFDENMKSTLSVEDLAVVALDEVESGKHIRKRFTAAY